MKRLSLYTGRLQGPSFAAVSLVRTGAVAVLGSAALWLTGCAIQAPPAPVSTAQLFNEDPTSQCMRTVNTDPRLALLTAKVGSLKEAGEATVPMLANTALPSPEEKTALEYWGSERQRCLGLGKVYRAYVFPASLVATFETGQKNLIFLTTRLYAGEITYGQFNTQRQELAGAMRQREVEFEQQRNSALAPPLQQVRPLYTNCTRLGSSGVNCISQ
jgi:hypothetical protein